MEPSRMLTSARHVLHQARQARGPVIEKWEGFERQAWLLLMLTVAVLVGLAATGNLHAGLVSLGGLAGLLVVGAYAAMFAARSTMAAGLAILAASVGAASAASHVALPLGVLSSNGLSGVVLVVSVAAAWTRAR